MAAATALGTDLLIAEAKQRARRRRLLALVALVVVAAASATVAIRATRSSANSLGVCATAPSGWKQRTVKTTPFGGRTVVLTNFQFGRMVNLYGMADNRAWPAGGVTVAVSNRPPSESPRMGSALRLTAKDFGRFEGMRYPLGEVAVRSHGRILLAYAEVGTLTPATIAAANEALASVRTCSA